MTEFNEDAVDDAVADVAAPEPAETKEETVEQVAVEEVKAVRKSKKVAVPGAAVSGGATDDVHLDRCVFKNLHARKSLTVHHLQRRLAELGYDSALTDRDGWYGDITRDAVASWQRDNNVDGDGTMTADTFSRIFADDPNVVVHV
jgi:peptidoglycan hydrolase-like protein with peptidoglycan-binding domain